jgi:2-polyprenyl-3-methyl-5-hydroxy-6-metoxy-1,4-benzoquinol methylase
MAKPRRAAALRWEPVKECTICGPTEWNVVEPGQNADLTLTACEKCGLVYLNPRLTAEATLELEAGSSVYEWSDRAVDDRIATLQVFILALENHSWPPGRLLDLGCNRGFLLQAARELGWEPTGVEISPTAADRARGETGSTVVADFSALAGQRFGLITAMHVLEHTQDPVGFLRSAGELLSPGGVLAVQVPSFDHVARFRERGQISACIASVHTHYFTERTLELTARAAGLSMVWRRNSGDDLMLTAVLRKTFGSVEVKSRPWHRPVVAVARSPRLRRWLLRSVVKGAWWRKAWAYKGLVLGRKKPNASTPAG